MPSVGDGARGQSDSVLAAMNFFKANTFVSMELFGTGVGGRKEAFISVAKNVASRLWTAMAGQAGSSSVPAMRRCGSSTDRRETSA